MDSWQRVALREIAHPAERSEEPVGGIEYRQIGVRLWGQGAYERESIDGGQTRYSRMFRTAEGDIIVNKIWARNGSVAVVPGHLDGCYASSEFPMFAPDRSRLLPRWFHWFTKNQDLWRQCDEQSRGTSGKNRIRPEKFLQVTIPLPPLAEQQRIVARIDALAARIEEAKGLRVQAVAEVEETIGSAVKRLFTKGSTAGWSKMAIGDLVEDVSYGTSEKAHSDPIGIPVLRMGNIQHGKLDTSDLKYMDLPVREFAKLKLIPGDILVNRTNSAELVGKCAVFNLEGDFVYASYIIRLRLERERAEPRLIARYINSPIGRAYMFAERKQMTGQANVNSKKLLALPIALPSLEEQCHIIAHLDDLEAKVDAVKRLQVETQAELDALLPSVLDRAFRGEL